MSSVTTKQLSLIETDITVPYYENTDSSLYNRYAHKLIINPELNRTLVSFQANKTAPFYRWFKYKEGFSSEFVLYIIQKFHDIVGSNHRILDPFAGAGTTLTTSTKAGWHATGIEILPVGTSAMRARLLADIVDVKAFLYYLSAFKSYSLNLSRTVSFHFPHLRITENAFSDKTEEAISTYMAFLNEIQDEEVRFLFWFACLSILENISYTCKDGQYLRWDTRSKRSLKSNFKKDIIHDFKPCILTKLNTMLEDITGRNGGSFHRNVEIIEGSCLSELPKLPDCSFDLVITSPPYCNRYDYTRTYALELAFMDYNEDSVKNLRQSLLSATVENKTKREQLAKEYKSRNQAEQYTSIVKAFTEQHELQRILNYLYESRDQGKLNNNNIPNMVENYFFEMNFVIHELARVLAPEGRIVMVNDNVQYHGEEIPVDLILSDFAGYAGLSVDFIWVLPKGKGNSSQQMGAHGRNEIRKCVYVWSKP
jgi:hypothetical protein